VRTFRAWHRKRFGVNKVARAKSGPHRMPLGLDCRPGLHVHTALLIAEKRHMRALFVVIDLASWALSVGGMLAAICHGWSPFNVVNVRSPVVAMIGASVPDHRAGTWADRKALPESRRLDISAVISCASFLRM